MKLKQPTSMQECSYFTNRVTDKGKIKTWVFKATCEKCKEGLMGKPLNEKTGRPKVRAQEYECNKCGNIVDGEEHEQTLTANIEYTCPHCSNEGEIQVPFIRKKVQRFNEEKGKKESVSSLRFQCEKCGENIDVTKKMK